MSNTKLADALRALIEHVDERNGDNECRPLENARAALAEHEAAVKDSLTTEREAFEAWATGKGLSVRAIDRPGFAIYRDEETAAAWGAWQARAAIQPKGEPVAWLYTLEYGSSIADRKVSIDRLRYPFGVCGADYLRVNDDGTSYVRETPLHQSPKDQA